MNKHTAAMRAAMELVNRGIIPLHQEEKVAAIIEEHLAPERAEHKQRCEDLEIQLAEDMRIIIRDRDEASEIASLTAEVEKFQSILNTAGDVLANSARLFIENERGYGMSPAEFTLISEDAHRVIRALAKGES